MPQGERLRSVSVPLPHKGVTCHAIAFATSGVVTAEEAQRAYIAASSGVLIRHILIALVCSISVQTAF